jgi:hypothetical protein
MQKISILLFCIIAIISCVQKTYKKTVVLNLQVAGIKNVQTVGVRGEGAPLSWEKDFIMTPVVKDSLYTVTITGETGYKFSEIKFTVNSVFELEGKENRKVFFSEGDTTVYNAVFNMYP